MALKILEDFIPIGHPNRPGTKLYGLKARVWHGTANYSPGATDTMHKAYMGRAYKKRWNGEKGKYEYFEADGITKFRCGGAHAFIDKDSATITVPLDEVVWGCGDRPLPYENGFNGQTRLAKEMFNHQNNYYTWNIELCMNDMNAWDKVLANAAEFAARYMPRTDIEDYRHFDMTGKLCPSPFVDMSIPEVSPAWLEFRQKVRRALAAKAYPAGTPLIMVNGKLINDEMDIQPFLKDGRVLAPVRPVVEALGKNIRWIPDKGIVEIE